MVRYVSFLLVCLCIVGEIQNAHGYKRDSTKLAGEEDDMLLKPIHIDGSAAELRMGSSLESYSEQVEEAEQDEIGQSHRFEFLITLEAPEMDKTQTSNDEYCYEPEDFDQIMLAVLRAAFMDSNILIEGIKEVSEGNGNRKLQRGGRRRRGRGRRRRRGTQRHGGYGARCDHCKTAGVYEDLSNDAIAAKMTGALRILIDTLDLDTEKDSCFFSMATAKHELLHVDMLFGK